MLTSVHMDSESRLVNGFLSWNLQELQESQRGITIYLKQTALKEALQNRKEIFYLERCDNDGSQSTEASWVY